MIKKLIAHSIVAIPLLMYIVYMAIPHYIQGLSDAPYGSNFVLLVQVISLVFIQYGMPSTLIHVFDVLTDKFKRLRS